MATPITLKVFRGNELVRTEQFTREIIKIGRLASAHLCLEDEKISRIHSVIEVAPDGAISIIDMGSAEGTFVNGKKVSRGALRAGDQITLGGLRIVLDGPEALAAPANTSVPEPVVNRAVAPAVAPAPAKPAGKANGTNGTNGANGTNGKHHAVAAGAIAVAPARPAAAPAPRDPRPVERTAAAPAAAIAAAAPAPAELPAPVARDPAPAAPAAAAPRARATRTWSALRAAERKVEDLSAVEDLGVELRVLWGETLLEASTFVRPKEPVRVGKGEKSELRIDGLPLDAFPMLRFEGGEYQFAFGKGMTGVLEDRDARTPFGELVRSRRAATDEKIEGAWWIPVPKAGAVRAEVGNRIAVEARPRQPEQVKGRPFWERINYQFLNLFLVLFFVQAGFVIAANDFPYDTDVVADDLFKNPSRMAKFVIKPPEAQPPKPVEKLPKGEKKEDPGEMAERRKGEEGQMGKKDAPKTDGRSAPKAIDPNAKEVVKNTGLLGAIGRGGSGGLSTVFGSGGLGGDLKGAVGNMFGPVVGDSAGLGGLGIRGSGSGGGGSGETIGIGAVGTKGRGGGLGSYGSGVGGLGKKSDRDVSIATGTAQVMGAIDRELVRKVIQDHAAQIRYCYEQQLTLNPRLQGKVSIKWVITADGSATSPQVDTSPGSTTLEDDKVHQCMMSRITSWQFPKPRGGGIAVITYPWILRSSGGD